MFRISRLCELRQAGKDSIATICDILRINLRRSAGNGFELISEMCGILYFFRFSQEKQFENLIILV